MFEDAWMASRLPGHAFEAQYRALVERMLKNLIPALLATSKATPLSVPVAGKTVTVSPDFSREVSGNKVLTVVRSGKRSSTESDKISHTLMIEAARMEYRGRFSIETFHVIEGGTADIQQTDAKRRNRMENAANAIRSMESGMYLAERSDFLCPRCPYFFICPAPFQRD